MKLVFGLGNSRSVSTLLRLQLVLLSLNFVKQALRWGGGIDPIGLCTQGQLYYIGVWFQGFPFQSFKNTYLFNIIMTRCLLDIKSQRILRLVQRNLKSAANVCQAITIFSLRRTGTFFKLLSCYVKPYTFYQNS